MSETDQAGWTETPFSGGGTTDPFLGTTLVGKYRILEVLGTGGMAVVYRARQVNVGRDVAVKILREKPGSDPTRRRRFENESKIVSRLRHPNTLRLFDCQQTKKGSLFIVTELLSGLPLSEEMKKGLLPLKRSLSIMRQICGSLAEAHSAGIVHRDLKPANIFLERVGNEDFVKVLDFGIAKLSDKATALTSVGQTLGTPIYMSPEQAMGKDLDARSDIYGLGVLLYFMIANRPPFRGKTAAEILTQHIRGQPPPLPKRVMDEDVTYSLDQLVMEMLAKNPAHRPQSTDDIRERITNMEETSSVVIDGTMPIDMPTEPDLSDLNPTISQEARQQLPQTKIVLGPGDVLKTTAPLGVPSKVVRPQEIGVTLPLDLNPTQHETAPVDYQPTQHAQEPVVPQEPKGVPIIAVVAAVILVVGLIVGALIAGSGTKRTVDPNVVDLVPKTRTKATPRKPPTKVAKPAKAPKKPEEIRRPEETKPVVVPRKTKSKVVVVPRKPKKGRPRKAKPQSEGPLPVEYD